MSSDYVILSSRRAYEFGLDELRLSRLTVSDMVQSIQQAFAFAGADIGTPMETFGPVPNTLPPGVAFNFGAVTLPDDTVTPIRFLHFEPYRLVVDVAGPSSAIDTIYERLVTFLETVHTADGRPILGQPRRVFNRSEVSSPVSGWSRSLLSSKLSSLFQETLDRDGDTSDKKLMLSLQVRLTPRGKEYAGAVPHQPFLQLEPRATTDSDSDILYSLCALTSDEHLAYLESLRMVLANKD